MHASTNTYALALYWLPIGFWEQVKLLFWTWKAIWLETGILVGLPFATSFIQFNLYVLEEPVCGSPIPWDKNGGGLQVVVFCFVLWRCVFVCIFICPLEPFPSEIQSDPILLTFSKLQRIVISKSFWTWVDAISYWLLYV